LLTASSIVGALCGTASALFLVLLDDVTAFRQTNPHIVYGLPVLGLAFGWFLKRFGASIRGGSDLVIDTLHEDRIRLSRRLVPTVLVGTLLTHVFGGSAGREGTAVQMGASLADEVAHAFGLSAHQRRMILTAGVAGGFGSVFGTPIAGAVFGLEVLTLGQLEWSAAWPALVASFVGDRVTRAWGVTHSLYPHVAYLPFTVAVVAKLVGLGIACGWTARFYSTTTHTLKAWAQTRIPSLPVRMFVGGAVLVAMWKLVGSDDYLGLGVPMILRAFHDPSLADYAFFAKLVFTMVTLSAGFLGGEVTPLFFVGATLGSVIARATGLPLELGAAAGMAAVFAAAANTPIALALMAAELVGWSALPHVVIGVAVAFFVSGHRGIYGAQRIARTKGGKAISPPRPSRDFREQ
jgi:H+/Cl- antiporter ClcA